MEGPSKLPLLRRPGSLLLLAALQLLAARTAHAACPRPVVPISLVVVGTGKYLQHGCVATFMYTLMRLNSYPAQTIIVLSEADMDEATFRAHFNRVISKLPSFMLITRPGKHNKADNINQALNHVTQPIISQFDVDDYMHPQRLDVIYRLFVDHPDLQYLLHTMSWLGEPPKPCNGTACKPVFPPFQRVDMTSLRLSVSYEEIRSVFVPYLAKNDFHYCCGLLKNPVLAHNGWPSYRRVVATNMRYSLVHWAEDSEYFSRAIRQGYNVTYTDAQLGLYHVLDRRREGYCPLLPDSMYASCGDPLCD